MTDYFILLQEPRRPWLDAAGLKQKFLGLSASVHPDKIHAVSDDEKAAAVKAFAELNTAFNVLAEPKSRLLHLLELESGARPPEIQQIPSHLADLFVEVATLCKNADAFLDEKRKATSPLLQVRLFDQAQEWIEKLTAMQKKLSELRTGLDDRLKILDQTWVNTEDREARRQTLPQLEELYRLFSYFNRWGNQVQERAVQMIL
ncbi:MAG TPA: hypothetical protein VN625_02505 [Desulfuromonadaceae bacterium]|nr:hypothetical protein [Desulfuromonadaceae bacterium]